MNWNNRFAQERFLDAKYDKLERPSTQTCNYFYINYYSKSISEKSIKVIQVLYMVNLILI